jgi:hypothetical protein
LSGPLRADYTKMNDDYSKISEPGDCNNTLETGDCSVSLLSYPILNEIKRERPSNTDGADVRTCCISRLTKVKHRFEGDVSLNPIPPVQLRTILSEHLLHNSVDMYGYSDPKYCTTPKPDTHEMRTSSSEKTTPLKLKKLVNASRYVHQVKKENCVEDDDVGLNTTQKGIFKRDEQ